VIRLIFDARMIKMSGIGRYIRSLIPELQKNFELILLGNKNDLSKYNVKVIPVLKPPYHPLEQLELFKKIPEAEIFWTPHFNVPLLPLRVKKRIATIHDIFHLTPFSRLNFFQKFYARLLYKNALKKSNIVFTISEFTKSEIIKYFPFMKKNIHKIKVIPRFAESIFKKKKFGKDERTTFLRKYDSPQNYILYVGNIKPHKNITGLIEAFTYLVKEKPSLKLMCVGQKENFITGNYNIKELLKEKGLEDKVIFTGIISDNELIKLYHFAEFLILPSFYEGFGLPPLEAFACGCPVIVSDIPPLREVCGNAAFYVNPFSIKNIAEGMERLIENSDLRKQLVKKGFKQLRIFNKEKILQKYIRTLNILLK